MNVSHREMSGYKLIEAELMELCEYLQTYYMGFDEFADMYTKFERWRECSGRYDHTLIKGRVIGDTFYNHMVDELLYLLPTPCYKLYSLYINSPIDLWKRNGVAIEPPIKRYLIHFTSPHGE